MTWGQIVEDRAREEGQRLQMLKLLRLKFGELPKEVTARVERASVEELDTWLQRIFTADSFEALFR